MSKKKPEVFSEFLANDTGRTQLSGLKRKSENLNERLRKRADIQRDLSSALERELDGSEKKRRLLLRLTAFFEKLEQDSADLRALMLVTEQTVERMSRLRDDLLAETANLFQRVPESKPLVLSVFVHQSAAEQSRADEEKKSVRGNRQEQRRKTSGNKK